MSCRIVIEKGVQPPSLDDVLNRVLSISTSMGLGATVFFVGIVKPVSRSGEGILGLEVIEEKPSAVESVVETAARGCRDCFVYVWHRVGFARVGNIITIICVAAKTRHEAFGLARKIIDSIKEADTIKKIEIVRNLYPNN